MSAPPDSVDDLRARLVLLRAALRGEPLTEGAQPTAEGHIGSAITKLERRIQVHYAERRG